MYMPNKMHLIQGAFFTILLIGIVSFFPQHAVAFSGTGSGTSGSPYFLTTCAQLQEINNELTAYYQLANDIDCSGGAFDSLAPSTGFSGTLDGHGYTISHLEISISNGYAGLFSFTADGAVIKNLNLRDGSVTAGSSSYSASFVGASSGTLTISDCSSTLTNIGESASGIVSLVNVGGTLNITRTYFSGAIDTTWIYGGGLVGIGNVGSTLNISDSYTSGNFTFDTYGGGLVGRMANGTITSSYSSAVIVADGGYSVGGLVGYISAGTVSNSFFAGSATGTSSPIGAVFGYSNGDFPNVYFDEYISLTTACSGAGSGTCMAVNAANSTPSYFKNNKVNPPLNSWNFAGVWKTTSSYPVFGIEPTAVQSSVTPPTQSTNNTVPTPPGCTDQAPENAPQLFQITAKRNQATLYYVPAKGSKNYYISFGYTPGDQRFGIEVPASDSNGVNSYTIDMLAPATSYYFTVRGGNGCMPGSWSNSLKATTTKNSSKSKAYYL